MISILNAVYLQGDITTGQLKAWDDIVAKTAELFEQLIALNKEVD